MTPQDLVHANEYMRGVALRFVQKLKHAQLIEPLIPSILQDIALPTTLPTTPQFRIFPVWSRTVKER